jgi:hypothetical protein
MKLYPMTIVLVIGIAIGLVVGGAFHGTSVPAYQPPTYTVQITCPSGYVVTVLVNHTGNGKARCY